MKRFATIFVVLLTAGVMFSLVGFGQDNKSGGNENAGKTVAPKQKTAVVAKETEVKRNPVESVWMNKKNFPSLKETSCPFYYSPPSTGC